MAIEEYGSWMIPAFVTLGSLGVLYPYLIEGFIIFSMILFVILFSLGKLFDKLNLRGYYDLFMASISVIFAFSYFGKFSPIFLITGVAVLAFAVYTTYFATQEIKYVALK